MELSQWIVPVLQILSVLVIAPFLSSINSRFRDLSADVKELGKDVRENYVSWDAYDRLGKNRQTATRAYRPPNS